MINRRLGLAAFAFAISHCDGGASSSGSTESPSTPRSEQLAPARCEMSRVQPHQGNVSGTYVAMANGPNGPRIFGAIGWWDGAAHGSVPRSFSQPDSAASVAWTGSEYVIATGRSLSYFNPDLSNVRATKVYPPGTCDLSAIEAPGGAVVTYRRLNHASESCAQGVGTLHFQRYTAGDQQISSAIELDTRAARDGLSAAHARWDAGRVVLSLLFGESEEWHLITSGNGEVFDFGLGGDTICARAGCIRVPQRSDVNSAGTPDYGATGETSPLHAVLLSRDQSIPLPIQAERVSTTAVDGDRVLLVTPSATNGMNPTTLSIFDVARHHLLAVHNTESETVETHWTLQAAPADVRVAHLGDTFAVTAATQDSEPQLRRVDCEP